MVLGLVVLTLVVFTAVDILLRLTLKTLERRRAQRARAAALDTGLRLDFTDEARSLRRVEVEQPKARLLAVDDEAVVLDSLRKIMVSAGYSIDTVERGTEAIGLIQKHDYDFVFVDLRMPDMDGVAVTKAVKHLRPDIDVIVITGYASVSSAVETMKFGAMDYLEKPFTEEELAAFVERAVIRRQDRVERTATPHVRLVTPALGVDSSRRTVNIHAGVFVSSAHCWLTVEMDGSVRVGLDDLAQKLLGPFDAVELPDSGRRLSRGDALFAVVREGRRLSFPSPVSGVVRSANTPLGERMGLMQLRPFALGWVCALEPSQLSSELGSLVIGANAVAMYRRDVDRYGDAAMRLLADAPGHEAAEDARRRLDDAAWRAYESTFLRA